MVSEDAYDLPSDLHLTGNVDLSGIGFDDIYLILILMIVPVLLLGSFVDIWYRFVYNSSLDAIFDSNSSMTGLRKRSTFWTKIFNYFIALFGSFITAVSLNSTLEFVPVLMSLDNFNLYGQLPRDGFPPGVDLKHRLWTA
jgi:hypothetical protein